MEGYKTPSPEELRQLILNSNEPFIIKQQLNWKLLKWSLQDWQHLLKNETLKFRCGTKSFSNEPQWERTTATKTATFKDFLLCSNTESEKWMYFDYKYLKEWFHNIQTLKENINWTNFGFPELSSDDCTIWMGSTGAHTPCHIDTYGCNLVAQIYGRKQWLLFPPEEDLKPTRIPYEESSIYSKLNFYSPTAEHFREVKHCRKIILEPGDVLFVPAKWWHYVENLDLAISINVWLPLPEDDEERLKESLVQLFISHIVKNLDKETKEVILNPNSDEDIENVSLRDFLQLINNCKSVVLEKNQNKQEMEVDRTAMQACFKKYSFLHKVIELPDPDFFKFIQEQRSRFSNGDVVQTNDDNELIKLLDAFTHSDTVTLIKNKLLQ